MSDQTAVKNVPSPRRFRRLSSSILLVGAAMLLSTVVATAAIPGLCNTGLSNGSGVCTGPLVTPDTGTTTDANWVIALPAPTASSNDPIPVPCVLSLCGTTSVYVPAWVDTPDPAWLPNNLTYSPAASEWITPQVEPDLGGQYIYAITFPVPSTAGHVNIAGQLLSDNEVYAIYLSSGKNECIPVAGYPYNDLPVNGPGDFYSPWTTFGFVHGPVTAGSTATLYFVVRNRGVGGSDSNPTSTGLRVAFDQVSSMFTP